MNRRKPTILKIIAGNPGKRPLNGDEPKPKLRIPTPPKWLSAEARAEWEYVATQLYEVGCLSGIDRGMLAAYCQAYGRWEQAERALAQAAENDPATYGLVIETSNGNKMQNPLVGAANVAMAAVIKCAVEFGMSPSARSRIHAQAPEEADAAKQYFTG